MIFHLGILLLAIMLGSDQEQIKMSILNISVDEKCLVVELLFQNNGSYPLVFRKPEPGDVVWSGFVSILRPSGTNSKYKYKSKDMYFIVCPDFLEINCLDSVLLSPGEAFSKKYYLPIKDFRIELSGDYEFNVTLNYKWIKFLGWKCHSDIFYGYSTSSKDVSILLDKN